MKKMKLGVSLFSYTREYTTGEYSLEGLHPQCGRYRCGVL